MTEPLSDVRDISKIAYAFFASKALFAALNLELFGHLADGPVDLATLTKRTGVPENRIATLLANLAASGLVVQRADGFVNSPAAARYLVPGEPAYFGDYYRFQIDGQLYPSMMAIDAGLRGDETSLAHASMSGMLEDPAEAEAFSRAQHAGSLGPALLLAKQLDLGGVASLLDVAGGTGAYSIVLCQNHPDLASTIIDFPTVTDVAERYIAEAGLADRIALLPGNALEVDWPEGQDAILMSYLISAVGAGDIPELLRRAHAALKPGGRLIVHDFMLEDDRSGPSSAAGFFLCYLTMRVDAVSFSAAELEPWLVAADFENPVTKVMIPEITKFTVARKPG
jgi:ubiquinone/menaquinone biosynthesis C-methylase UbiE